MYKKMFWKTLNFDKCARKFVQKLKVSKNLHTSVSKKWIIWKLYRQCSTGTCLVLDRKVQLRLSLRRGHHHYGEMVTVAKLENWNLLTTMTSRRYHMREIFVKNLFKKNKKMHESSSRPAARLCCLQGRTPASRSGVPQLNPNKSEK